MLVKCRLEIEWFRLLMGCDLLQGLGQNEWFGKWIVSDFSMTPDLPKDTWLSIDPIVLNQIGRGDPQITVMGVRVKPRLTFHHLLAQSANDFAQIGIMLRDAGQPQAEPSASNHVDPGTAIMIVARSVLQFTGVRRIVACGRDDHRVSWIAVDHRCQSLIGEQGQLGKPMSRGNDIAQ